MVLQIIHIISEAKKKFRQLFYFKFPPLDITSEIVF